MDHLQDCQNFNLNTDAINLQSRSYPVYHPYQPPHPMMYVNHHPVPQYLPPTGFRGQMLREISDAVAAVVFGQRHSDQINQHNA